MICPYCDIEAEWVENKTFYGRNFGKSFMAWWCRKCGARVGCHQNTKQPLGTMANASLRKMRQHVHGIIDPLWQSGKITRKEIYRKLSEEMSREVHVGESNNEQCKEIIRIVQIMLNENRL